MARTNHEDEWEDPIDPEGPSAADLERFGDEFRDCPSCGARAYDQSPLCPKCGHAFEEKTSSTPVWVVAVVVLILIAFTLVMVF